MARVKSTLHLQPASKLVHQQMTMKAVHKPTSVWASWLSSKQLWVRYQGGKAFRARVRRYVPGQEKPFQVHYLEDNVREWMALTADIAWPVDKADEYVPRATSSGRKINPPRRMRVIAD